MKNNNILTYFKFVLSLILIAITLLLIYTPITDDIHVREDIFQDKSMKLFNRGKFLYKIDEYNQAIYKLDSSISLQYFYAPSHLYRGILYEQIGMLDSSIVSFQRALELSPESFEVRLEMAEVMFKVGKKEVSERLIREAYHINPEKVESLYLNDTLNNED